MGTRSTASKFVRRVMSAKSADDLAGVLSAISSKMGFEYFALTHHVDICKTGPKAIRVHNYPSRWADYYDANALGVVDPVHRASHVTSVGFMWSRIPHIIQLTAHDRRMFALGREQGIGDGFTVPAHIPGETLGSCSFANTAEKPVPQKMLPLAQLVGAFAFEGARRIWSARAIDTASRPTLTDRQRDCVLWVARGKSDWETGRILGVSEQTVTRHIQDACERYEVHKRTLLAIRALFDGTLAFSDIFRR